jgi:hypothetical protein
LKPAILWRQNFYWEKIGVRILYLLFLSYVLLRLGSDWKWSNCGL